MSYADGWAALNLQKPPRIPRTEASVNYFVMSAVTGIDVNVRSPGETQLEAVQKFVKAWNYDMLFGCAVGYDILQKKYTSMGHAVYDQFGIDYDEKIFCPWKDVEEVFAFDPWEIYGPLDRKAMTDRFNGHYRGQVAAFPDLVNMTGIYTTLMSGMIAIFGWDMLLTAAGTDPKRFGEVVNRYAGWIQQYYDALGESEAPVIYSHDDMVWTEGAFTNPAWYREFVFPNLKKLWAPLVESGKKVIFFCDGNYTEFLDDVAACGNSAFWFEVFTDLPTVIDRFGRTHAIIGNVDVRVLTFGTKQQIRDEVRRCMDLGRDCPGYFMCCSGHIPPNVPVENALYYNEAYEKFSRR